FIPLSSSEFSSFIDDESCDVVYFDGDHRYETVKDDIARWTPKVRNNGLMIFNEMHGSYFPGVIKAINESDIKLTRWKNTNVGYYIVDRKKSNPVESKYEDKVDSSNPAIEMIKDDDENPNLSVMKPSTSNSESQLVNMSRPLSFLPMRQFFQNSIV